MRQTISTALAASILISGCVPIPMTKERMEGYKGTGAFRIVHATPAQIFDAAAQASYIGRRAGWSYSRNDDAFIGWKPFAPLSSGHGIAIFTYPADDPGDTKVEVVTHFPGQPGARAISEGLYLDEIEKRLAGDNEEDRLSGQQKKMAALGRAPISAAPPVRPAAPAAPTYSSDVDRPGKRLAADPKAFAVVVGVEKYANGLPSAPFAERDAQAARAALVALGFPERNIKVLIGARASKSNMEAMLEDWLPRNAKEDGRVFFYFSGHGAPDPGSSRAYLVPFDGDPKYLDKTAYPVKKLYAGLGELKTRQIVVALDACFSGAGGRSVLADGTRPLVTQADAAVGRDSRITLFSAASPKEITSTLQDQGHGAFTYYFLKGLQGAAADESGTVTAQGLYDYLKPQVQDAAGRQNREQTPMLEGAAGRQLAQYP